MARTSHGTRVLALREVERLRPSQLAALRRQRALDEMRGMRVLASGRMFDRRVTCVQWHPDPQRASDVAVLASHGGDIRYWKFRTAEETELVVSGQGKGGSISEMKFHPRDPNVLFTTSIDQTVKRHEVEARRSAFFLDTMDRDHWFVSLDVSLERGVLLAGDNLGWGHLVTLEGEPQGKVRLHKKKVQTVGFSPRDPNLLVTSSNDYTVCLWDVRKLDRPTEQLPHGACINSAYFSPLSGTRLLTTAQNDKLRVYDLSGNMHAPLVVEHPHKHFQHLTKIKAVWHPLDEGLIAVGRYDDSRAVDVLDAATGQPRARLQDAACPTITTSLAFGADGSALLAGSGQSGFVWSRPAGAEGPLAEPAGFAAVGRGGGGPRPRAKGKGPGPAGTAAKKRPRPASPRPPPAVVDLDSPASSSSSARPPAPAGPRLPLSSSSSAPAAAPSRPPPAVIELDSSPEATRRPPPWQAAADRAGARDGAGVSNARARPPPQQPAAAGRNEAEAEEEDEEGGGARPAIPFESFRFGGRPRGPGR